MKVGWVGSNPSPPVITNESELRRQIHPPMRFTMDELAGLRAYAKKHEVTVTALIVAAMIKSNEKFANHGSHPGLVNIAINLRNYLGMDASTAGLLTSMMLVQESYTNSLEQIAKTCVQRLKSDDSFSTIALEKVMRYVSNRPAVSTFPKFHNISNLGDKNKDWGMSLDTVPGRLDEGYFGGTYHYRGGSIMTLGSKMTFWLHCLEENFLDGESDLWLKSIETILKDIGRAVIGFVCDEPDLISKF